MLSQKRSGRPSKLTKKQRKQLSNLIERGPEACGFKSACWSTPMIQELILEEFSTFYSANYLSQLLKELGFSYQKAKFVAAKQDDDLRQKWLEETWPKLLKKAKKIGAYVLSGVRLARDRFCPSMAKIDSHNGATNGPQSSWSPRYYAT